MKRAFASIAPAVVLVAACSLGPSERVGDSARWGEVSLVEDLRIGRSEGPAEYLFASIADIAQHPDGSVFLVDESRASTFVRHYDGDGNHLNDVGRMGQGPGEFQQVAAIAITPDGNLALLDTLSRRLTIMRPDGGYVDSFFEDSGLKGSEMLRVDPSGNFYIRTLKEDHEDRDAQRINGYLKYSPNGELLDTIWLPRSGSMRGDYWVWPTSIGAPYPFVRQTVSTVTTNGVVVSGANESYTFEYALDGEVQFRIERPWEPIPLRPAERLEWMARQAEISGQPIPTSIPVNAPPTDRYLPIPETKPAFSALRSGADGTVWVQRYVEADQRTDLEPLDPGDKRVRLTWMQHPTYDVFGREGEFLGTVELPHETWPVQLHSDYIWTVRQDEQGENVAVRYRIVKGGGS